MRLFDFSSGNLFRLNKNYGNILAKLNPSYFSKICTTTSLFTFLLKDAVEYAGLVFVEKKSQLALVYNTYTYFVDTFEIKKNQMDDKLAEYNSLATLTQHLL